MSGYRVVALEPRISAEVRATGKSPRYGHAALWETATGTGPCRSCLRLFKPGEEERIRFTYQPQAGAETLGAPGPVFVHAEDCAPYQGLGFPNDLQRLPLVIEGRTQDGRIIESRRTPGEAANEVITALFDNLDVDFLFLRHGEAGCHIARVDRSSETDV